MLAGLATHAELLMLALDVLVEAEQLVLSTGAGVVLLVCISKDAGLTFFNHTYRPLVEFPRESND